MRTLIAFSLLVICSGVSFGQTPGSFRKSQWGVTESQVKKSEHLQLIAKDTSRLTYSGYVLGHAATVIYKFYKGRLYMGQINFVDCTENSCVEDFNSIKEGVESDLGSASTKYHWSNYALEYSASSHQDQWGEAIYQGYLVIESTWSANRTVSKLNLSENGLVFISEDAYFAPPAPSAAGEF